MAQEQLRMQMLAGIITEGEYKTGLNENTQAAVDKWAEGYLKGTTLTSNYDYEKYGSQDNPEKVKYVIDGAFKKDMLDVKYSYNAKIMHIPYKVIEALGKEMGNVEPYKVIEALIDYLKRKGYKQQLETDYSRSGLKVGEMSHGFFHNPITEGEYNNLK